MQVRTVQGGTDALNALVYPQPDPTFLQYLDNNLQYAKEKLGGIATGFVDTVNTLYNKYNGEAILNAGKMLLQNVGGHMNQNVIYPVSYEQLGNANYVMQRYIMAEPTVNKLYQTNSCMGFDQTYVDYEPDNVGKERLDYRNVMNGVLDFDNDEGVIRYYSHDDEDIYTELNKYGELDVLDKFSILETWDNVAYAIAGDIDPTSYDMDEL